MYKPSRIFLGFCCAIVALVGCAQLEPKTIQDGLERLGPSGYGFQNPVWSPDGTKIAVTTQTVVHSWTSEIFILDVLTGKKKSILRTDQGNVMAIAWSPDGSQILLASQNGGAWIEGLWVLNMDATTPAAFLAPGYNGDWSPNGKKMAVFSHSEKGAHQDVVLRILNLETGDSEVVFGGRSTNVSGGGVRWSPNGQELLFDYGPSDGKQLDLYALSLTTKVATRVSGNGRNYNPSWQPEGDLFVFVNVPSKGADPSLYIADKNNSCQQLLVTLDDLSGSSWSPDGDLIAFISHGEIYLLDLSRFPSYKSACP